MTRIAALFTAVCMALCLLAGCGAQPDAAPVPAAPSATDAVSASDEGETPSAVSPAFLAGQLEYTVGDPVITDVSPAEKQIDFYRDGLRLYGKMYLPEGDGPFPCVVLASGFRAPMSTVTDVAKSFAEGGVAAVIFDFAGAASPSKSEGKATDLAVSTEAADLCAVLDSVKNMDFIDENSLFLWGHSFGGLAAAYTASARDDVQGMVLVEPAFPLRDELAADYPEGTEIPEVTYSPLYAGRAYFEECLALDIYELIPRFGGDVLIVLGNGPTASGEVKYDYYERANGLYPSSEIVTIDGAGHAFTEPEQRGQLIDASVEFVSGRVGR